jgi:hypothetical protein
MIASDAKTAQARMICKARDVLATHRFSYLGGVSHSFRIAVTGPPQSGKSTYLAILAQQVMLELVSAGDWKGTFLFPLDIGTIAHQFYDLGGLYQSIVHITFQSLAGQNPLVAQFAGGLSLAFENVIGGKPLIPRAFALSEDFRLIVPEIRRLLDSFVAAWSDSTALELFLSNTIRLPLLIGRAFGYQKFVLIIDHVDLADVTLKQTPPFEEADFNAFVIEYVKQLMVHTSFIASCKDSAAIGNLFPSLCEGSIDLTEGLEFTSTLDLADPTDEELDDEFVIALEDDETPVTLSVRHCGGCAVYMKAWEELMTLADQVEDAGTEREKEELNLFLNAQAHKIAKQLFVAEDGSPLNLLVKGVNRVHGRNAARSQ